MSDTCNCIDIKVEVMMDEPKIKGEVDVTEVILCSDGEDYKRGYEEGHEKGYADGKKDGITEGYNNGYEQGKTDGYSDGYKKGYETGYSEGYEKGLADGIKEEQEKSIAITKNGTVEISPDENKVLSRVTVDVNVADSYYDTFWDNFQNNGIRTVYDQAFRTPWNDNIFKPKYDIKPKTAEGIFYQSKITNLKMLLEEQGIVFDTSKTTDMRAIGRESSITHLPCISVESCTSGNMSNTFYLMSSLVYIEKLVSTKNTVWGTNTFGGCKNLTTIEEIGGEIGSSFNVQYCSKLDDLTVDNIVNAYADMTGQTAPVLTFHADVKARVVADDAKEDTDPTKHNWLKTLTSKNVTLA